MIFKGIEICCPHCHGDFQDSGESLICTSCRRRFPVVLGIPDLRTFSDPYVEVERDRKKGLQVSTRFDDLDFSQLVDFYYGMTPKVPRVHAQQYKKGLMAGVARSEAAMAAWEKAADCNGQPGSSVSNSLLEIGCGTAPLLVGTAQKFSKVIGIDIAFRWLVVAKKRLQEANSDVPLICACAEALPFPNGSFDRIVAESVIEHVSDQERVLMECHRVMRPDGYFFVSTPNRYNLGPDPHTGIWAGSLLPKRWSAAYVCWKGGIPPKRMLFSARSLRQSIRAAGFSLPRIMLPTVPTAQRRHYGKGLQLLIDLYQVARRLPLSRQLLLIIGPLLQAVARKQGNSSLY